MLDFSYLGLAPLLLAFIGLGIILFSEQVQIIAKYRGSVSGGVARGYNLAMKVMVGNRVGAVLYFFFMGFNIDSGVSPENLVLGFAISLIFLVMPLSLVVMYHVRFSRRFYRMGVWEGRRPPIWIGVVALIATSFNILGLTLPWIAGAIYPEWRLTLVNSSFIFNTIYTVTNVFYIEHKFAMLVDQGDPGIHAFVLSTVFSRVAALLIVGVTMLVYWL
ncbi:MAG: hypothetical protein HWE24_13715 [Oceanospirillaceae bacterium]|nr:hypothetical protein [Oceanospirillaceae bacterium]